MLEEGYLLLDWLSADRMLLKLNDLPILLNIPTKTQLIGKITIDTAELATAMKIAVHPVHS